MLRIGVLAIQGDFQAHGRALRRAGAEAVLVRHERDLDGIDGLVIPGGESTTIAHGLDRLGLYLPLEGFAVSGRPILGTCAGAILLAQRIENHPVKTLGLLDITLCRNAYGTQVNSFSMKTDPVSDEAFRGLRCVFIRAPRIVSVGQDIEVLATVDKTPVLVRSNNLFAATFHPELTDDPRVHTLLVSGATV